MATPEGEASDFVTLGYQAAEPGGELRPYLWLELEGLNGRKGLVRGLVDTGADTCVLPLGYARLMGYTSDDLQVEECEQVQGSTTAYDALRPCTARLEGMEVEFELRPLFVDSAKSLWGRRDFLDTFGLFLTEATKEFSLILPEET